MHRADAYEVIARELNSWRSLGYERLVELVGRPVVTKMVHMGEEDVVVEVRVRWKNKKAKIVSIEAMANGPSSWRLERLEESIVVGPDETAFR